MNQTYSELEVDSEDFEKELDVLISDINTLLDADAIDNQHESLYRLVFNGFVSTYAYGNYNVAASRKIEKVLGRNCPEASAIRCDRKYTIFDGITETNAQKMQEMLRNLGCRTEILLSRETKLSPINKKIENLSDDIVAQNDVLKCPRCCSTSISIGSRGYSLVWGFVGSNKTVNRCGKCGYTWKP